MRRPRSRRLGRPRQTKTAYKPDQAEAIGRIEGRRLALKLSVDALAERAGLNWRQLMRIRKVMRAWPREIRALNMALRSIEQERAKEGELFGG